MASKEKTHIPGARGLLFGLRVAQLLLAMAILGLSAYGLYWLIFAQERIVFYSLGFIYMAAMSIVICFYVMLASTAVPVIYNYWAVLGLDILASLLWLVAFPFFAPDIVARIIANKPNIDYMDDSVSLPPIEEEMGDFVIDNWETYRNVMIATFALSAVEWCLFMVTFVILVKCIHRHRKDGGHCMSGSAAPRKDEVETKFVPQHNMKITKQSQPEVYHPPVTQCSVHLP
ncbi:hypothetical protein SBOR_7307 [Sclerotinia borealis F-4128]|uniref:MARVEL domain-containing protein n=1 Tax=Sclerotinia borealis (strain F-4128) TaxID=1432307 RepID=W9C914_SCLBF|nr:hypothetical protein SBOR_7307 [Sclerotinia borealis F-4128]